MENEKINLSTFLDCGDIKENDVLEFLKSEGYNISNFKCKDVQEEDISQYNSNHEFHFNNFDELDYTTYNSRLVLLASPNTWKDINYFENINENFVSTNCRNNPLVRYIYFSISKFKVYEVLQDIKHPRYLTIKLEYDLSKEWVQFLAKRKENYKPSLIQLIIKQKQSTLEKLERCKQETKKEKEKLDEDLKKVINNTNKEIESFDETTSWLEELSNN